MLKTWNMLRNRWNFFIVRLYARRIAKKIDVINKLNRERASVQQEP